MTKRIVIEGMDGAGKSTLAADLVEWAHPAKLVRNELGPRDDLYEWWQSELNLKMASTLVYDRFFYPELVYGPILRGRVKVPWVQIFSVMQSLRSQAFLIYCRPALHKIEGGAQTKEQWPGVMDNFQALLGAYDAIMIGEIPWYGTRFFRYDWEQEGALDALKESLQEYING